MPTKDIEYYKAAYKRELARTRQLTKELDAAKRKAYHLLGKV